MSVGEQVLTQIVNGFGDFISLIFSAFASSLINPIMTVISQLIFGATAGS